MAENISQASNQNYAHYQEEEKASSHLLKADAEMEDRDGAQEAEEIDIDNIEEGLEGIQVEDDVEEIQQQQTTFTKGNSISKIRAQ